MGELVIVGASAMGRETCAYAQEAGMAVKGFLDSRMNILDSFPGYPPILGTPDGYRPGQNDVFVCAIGDCSQRRRYAELISSKGGRFASVVHPSAYLGHGVGIGSGCIVCPSVIITNEAVLGEHVIVNIGATVNHDCRIGDFTTVCPGVNIAGRVRIEADVFIGTGALCIPDVEVGRGAVIGGGAVVRHAVAAGHMVVGNPARILRDVST